MEENCEGKAREKNRTIRFWQNYVINKLKEKEKERKQKLQALSELLDKLQDKAVFDWHQDSSKFISVSNFAELRKKFEELLEK